MGFLIILVRRLGRISALRRGTNLTGGCKLGSSMVSTILAPNAAKIQILSQMLPGNSCCTSNVKR
jgi:hypothetical protein